MSRFRCGHRRTRANTAHKVARGRPYVTCRQCQNRAQRDHQARATRRTGRTQWRRREH